jgi:hypothetical protein
MKMKNITAIILSFVTLQVYSQNSSKPYFQQHVAYTIQVKLNDNEHMLSGTESCVFYKKHVLVI